MLSGTSRTGITMPARVKSVNDLTDSLTLKASKSRYLGYFVVVMVFLLIALFADFPRAPFFRIIKIVAVPACLLAMTVVMPGMMSNRYDAVLSRSGIEFGTFSGKRRFRWSDIQAFY